TGNAVLRLRALLTESQGKLVTAPIIRTLNNQPATVFAFTTSYIFATNQAITNGILSNTVNPIAIQSGTSLTVAPRINADGFITLALNPQVGGISNIQLGPNGAQYPNVSSQGVFCVARVRNKETIVLGGLNIENILYSENRVPVLGDLPIIGQFFRRRITNKRNSELLIFVTPEVVQDDSGDNINP
ncbi:type II and III secretion system protein, partial [bacterium]